MKNIFVLCGLILCFVGCSGEERLVLPEATLKGTVTYNGKKVPYALVIVSGTKTNSTANADAEGNYSVVNVAAEELRIGVNSEAGRGAMMGAMMASAQSKDKSKKPDFVDVPKKFFDPTTSGITTTVSDPKGTTTFDIVLK